VIIQTRSVGRFGYRLEALQQNFV